ncbi:MAG: DUF3226 domain-containing protein [Chitinophagaceae bacterium]|jgi:hypothetical protein
MRDFGLNKIFVEGKSDKIFIEAVLFKYFGIDSEQEGFRGLIVNTEGKDKLKKVDLKNQPDLINTERIQANAKNLIIFDTDYESKGGGLYKRRKEYQKVSEEAGADFRIYLLPNDSDEGELENLVKTCFKDEFVFFDKCWQGMIGCFEKQEGLNLNLPEIKGYNYSYSDLLKAYRSNEIKNEYLDEGLWNLNTDTNKDLKKLVDFIEQNFFED